MDNIIIPKPSELENKIKSISKQGVSNVHVLADFDRTLTKAFTNGEKFPSLISVLRDNNYLTDDYAPAAHKLFDQYHPIEIDPNISSEGKKLVMQEWWTKHFELLIKSGLKKTDLEDIITSSRIQLRPGAEEFFQLLSQEKIPLVIMSSCGIGDAIVMYLEQQKLLFNNIYVITNRFVWDEEGKAVEIKKPIIHVMNKDETAIRDYPIYEVVKNKRNVLLLGDSLGDVGMITGFDHENIIKIGFLNEEIEDNLDQYKENYDVVILNDFAMDYVNQLLKKILL